MEELLARVIGPRPNGSAALERAADAIAAMLRAHGAEVTTPEFTATPHGFALVWTAVLACALGFAWALRRRPALALACAVVPSALMLAEFERLRSPVSGLWPATERNVVATFAGRPSGPTLLFSAHYDTTTHFGDHFDWPRIGWGFAPAGAVGVAAAGWALGRRRRGRTLPGWAATLAPVMVLLPALGMVVCQTLAPLVRTPSPGALDDGGSVAVLLALAERLGRRPPGSPVTVQLAFFAAEEERALGSWRYAGALAEAGRLPAAVVNLECVGAGAGLAYVADDGFTFRRWPTPPALVELLDDAARAAREPGLAVATLPPGSLTDGRSFLARGVPTLTLVPAEFPRRLHSWRDDRDRVDVGELERTVALLDSLVTLLDGAPQRLVALGAGTTLRTAREAPC